MPAVPREVWAAGMDFHEMRKLCHPRKPQAHWVQELERSRFLSEAEGEEYQEEKRRTREQQKEAAAARRAERFETSRSSAAPGEGARVEARLLEPS